MGLARPTWAADGEGRRWPARWVGEGQKAGKVGQDQSSRKRLSSPVSPVCAAGESQVLGEQAPHPLTIQQVCASQALWVLVSMAGGLPVAPLYQAGCPWGREGAWAALALRLVPCPHLLSQGRTCPPHGSGSTGLPCLQPCTAAASCATLLPQAAACESAQLSPGAPGSPCLLGQLASLAPSDAAFPLPAPCCLSPWSPETQGARQSGAWTSLPDGWQTGTPSLACPLALHCNLRTLVPQLCRAALAHECEHECELAGTLEHCNTGDDFPNINK